MSPNRFNISDFVFDSNFKVSCKKDFQKHVTKADLAAAQVGIVPIFENMFSDLTTDIRQILVLKVDPHRSRFVNYVEKSDSNIVINEAPDLASVPAVTTDATVVDNSERYKYFKLPVINLLPETLFGDKSPDSSPRRQRKGPITVGVQTIFRDSSAQTEPWKPKNYVIIDGSTDPEILKINFLKENLPPGMHEVDIIRCARRRRQWEQLIPDIKDEETLRVRKEILEAIEIDQWAFREEEIEAIQTLRMELLERMLYELMCTVKNRTELRLHRKTERLQIEKEDKMKKLIRKKERELRRLYRQNFGIVTKYHTQNIIEEHADYKSEVYAPLMRFGEHPKRAHANINVTEIEPPLEAVNEMSTLPQWLFKKHVINVNKIKLPGKRLCIRETKWTEKVLKQLHQELLDLHVSTKYKCTLRVKKVKPQILLETMTMEDEQSLQESDEFEAVLILQSIIRGRSTQTVIFEGRDRCRELIEELQYTHFLDVAQNAAMKKKRLEVLNQQRMKEISTGRENTLEDALNTLQGSVVGTMLDFLSKELVRILDERKVHAMALLYERERRDKEAAEAGRRQLEDQRRSEHDEMFRQVVKVHQDTVDLYLRDIISEGVEKVSEENAEKYIETLIDDVEYETQNPPQTFLEKEELIANLVCHFIVPEVEKLRIQKKINEKQKKYLRCAHEAIFDKIDNLPKLEEDDKDACLEPEPEVFELPSLPPSLSELEQETQEEGEEEEEENVNDSEIDIYSNSYSFDKDLSITSENDDTVTSFSPETSKSAENM